MIARALQLSTVASTTGFADDEAIPAWAKGAVAVLKQAGIVDGRDHNRFVPDDNATRAEAITILLRIIEEN